MNFSDDQLAILRYIRNESGNLMIKAGPGSGKTTLLVEATKYIPFDCHMLAFNSSVATELKQRIKNGTVSTLHSLGLKIITQNLNPSAQVTKNKYTSPVYKEFKRDGLSTIYTALDLMDLLSEQVKIVSFDELCEVDTNTLSHSALQRLYNLYLDLTNDTSIIGFSDMLVYPLRHKLKFPTYSTVLVDEAQDLSGLQHAFIRRVNTSRYIFVGDANQAIYGFAGADTSSFNVISETFSCKQLSMPECFRVPNNLLEPARQVDPTIYSKIPDGELYSTELTDERQTHLYRANSTLLKKYSDLGGQANLRCTYSPWKIIKKLENVNKDLEAFEASLEAITTGGEDKAIISFLRAQAPTSVTTYQQLGIWIGDFIATGRDSTFYPITLSTIHQAKGLEWDNVTLHMEFPGIQNRQESQEANLFYVGSTRAKKKLGITKN